MAKEKNFNPVQEHKKSEKQKQIKKQKATVQAQRNERLARRNPARIQRDIDQLKELEQSGEFRPHDRQKLAQLEKDLAAVNKARTALGDKAPQFKEAWRDESGDRGGRGGHRGRGGAGVLGKRRRDGSWKGRDGQESSDTDADVANIPMPRDTPPPIPLRNRGRKSLIGAGDDAPPEPKKPTIVYESAPQVRDLQKEAAQFVPAVVAAKMKLAKGEVQGKLMEPEEFDELERKGYLGKEKEVSPADQDLEQFIRGGGESTSVAQKALGAAVEEAEHDMMAADIHGEMNNPRSFDKAAEQSLRHVEMEEVEDEDL